MNKALIRQVAQRTMRWNFRLWGFGEAIALRGLLRAAEVTGDTEPVGFVQALLRAYVARGVAKSPEEHVAPGTELLLLFERSGDAAFQAKRTDKKAYWGSRAWGQENSGRRRTELARALFCVRLLQLAGQARREDGFAFLCGAFIGSDLRALVSRQTLRPEAHVVIAGRKPLAAAWQHALAENSIRATLLADGERESALLTGLHVFAQAAGARLLTAPARNPEG